MKKNVIVGGVLGIAVIVFLLVYVQQKKAPPETVEVLGEPAITIIRTNSGYEPKEVTIKKADVVLWKNESDDYHWPASDLHPTHAIYSEFDPLKPVAPDADWAFKFDQTGTWKYHDHIRANKVGIVTVIE